MTTGCKVWLWLVLVLNLISLLGGLIAIIGNPILGILIVVTEIAIVAGAAMLLFNRKKIGFYVIVGAAVVAFVLNLISGAGLISSLISVICLPGITYLFVSKNSGIFY